MARIDLTGLRVLNTRPFPQNKPLSRSITNAGGEVIECPALEIVANAFQPPEHGKADYAIFTSANAVTYAQASLKNWPQHMQVIAIGQATANALQQYGITVTAIPTSADSENLLALPMLQHISQSTILLFKGVGGRTLIADTLRQRGAHVIELAVYQRAMPRINQEQLAAWWHNDAVDIILFTSHEVMLNIFKLFGEQAHAWLRHKPCLVFGDRLAKEANRLGIVTIIISAPETILEKLHHFNQGLTHGNKR
ncbi:uroporphyrinogen-III synthase [Legionella dresdenensis]|uniref:Uroporphyrinogen-III synthase n=1 Tax=Legionella dresdenensis TaxID=450200 RepID=A0ABV8CD95_9GAMM